MDIKAASFTDIARAEATDKYGHVHRGLKARHVQFIALGGAIGTGLFLGIGRALSKSGPLSLVLGYAIVGIAIFMMMMALGEMAAWLPLPGAIPQFCSRYVDEALGFAVGWNTWFTAVITLCAEISAACSLIQFWEGAEHINNAVWIVILIVLVLGLNIFAVSIYGEAEFIFASIKVVTILGLLILSLVIDLGGSPKQPRLGFHYWKTDGAMKEYISAGDTGRFLGLFSTLVNAAFSMGGIETVAVAAGEAEDPRRNIPKAVKRVFWRILFFYVIGALAVGVICPSNDQNLLGSGSSRAQSPWVIAINLAGIRALPSIINVVIISSATSAGNAYVYTGSRYLYALAQNNHAPKVFLYCTGRGVPIYSVLLTASISLLSFMSISASSSVVFEWFQNLTTIANMYEVPSFCISFFFY